MESLDLQRGELDTRVQHAPQESIIFRVSSSALYPVTFLGRSLATLFSLECNALNDEMYAICRVNSNRPHSRNLRRSKTATPTGTLFETQTEVKTWLQEAAIHRGGYTMCTNAGPSQTPRQPLVIAKGLRNRLSRVDFLPQLQFEGSGEPQ